nr:MAG TPA_asm: distal tail protein [Caudoviricetes sp.]
MHVLKTFNFDNTPAPEWLLCRAVRRPLTSQTARNTVKVPGRPGSYPMRKERGERQIEVDITVMSEDSNDLFLKAEYLAGWLERETALPLRFNDEPNRYYMAELESGNDFFEELQGWGEVTLKFRCTDPYKYGEHFNLDYGTAENVLTFANNGNAPYSPFYRVEFTQDADFFNIITPDGFVMYGKPRGEDEVAVKPEETILFDQFNDLAPYSASGINVDYGEAAGSMTVDRGFQFVVSDFGEGSGWHGPVIKRSLPAQIQDFRAVFDLQVNSTSLGMMRVEAWLLSASGQIIARMILWDKYSAGELNAAIVTAGPNSNAIDIMRTLGITEGDLNDFNGRIILRRVGNKWQTTVTPTDSAGRDLMNKQVYEYKFLDSYSDPIAQLQVGIRKYGTTTGNFAALKDMRIQRINSVDPNAGEVKKLFEAGDILEIDTRSGSAWKNGIYFNDELDPGSSFKAMKIQPGITEVKANTTNAGAVNITVDYDERYK